MNHLLQIVKISVVLTIMSCGSLGSSESVRLPGAYWQVLSLTSKKVVYAVRPSESSVDNIARVEIERAHPGDRDFQQAFLNGLEDYIKFIRMERVAYTRRKKIKGCKVEQKKVTDLFSFRFSLTFP